MITDIEAFTKSVNDAMEDVIAGRDTNPKTVVDIYVNLAMSIGYWAALDAIAIAGFGKSYYAETIRDLEKIEANILPLAIKAASQLAFDYSPESLKTEIRRRDNAHNN